jgi:hypothetical protein
LSNLGSTTNEVYQYQFIFLPTFKNHCVGVEANGKLRVEMKRKSIEFLRNNYALYLNNFKILMLKCLLFFIFGFILLVLAEKISRNVFFQYITGTSIGIIGFILILAILITRFFQKVKVFFFY